MKTSIFLALALGTLVGCGTEEGTTNPVDTSPPTDTSAPIEPPAPSYWEPAAVGFELTAVLDADGNLVSWLSAGTEQAPLVLMTFASVEYFSSGGDDQKCEVYAQYIGLPSDTLSVATMPANGGDVLDLAPDQSISLFNAFDGTTVVYVSDDCAAKLDPAVWGDQAGDLLLAFDGMHLGFGFGPLSDYSWQPYIDSLDSGDLTQDEFDTIKKSAFTEYVAINDKNGNYVGVDWTLGRTFEWDASTREAIADADGFLVALDVSAEKTAGSSLPATYIRSNAFWYQDFPFMDLANLKDGAPAAPAPPAN